MYRDELTKASQRLEELEEKLAGQRSELAGLREQVTKRLGPPPPTSRWGYLLVASGAAAVATLWCWIAFTHSAHGRADASASTSSAATTATSARRPPPPTETSFPARGDPLAKTPAPPPKTHGKYDLHIPVASDERVVALSGRCRRDVPRASLDHLPSGTRVIDFRTCGGCHCCLPGGLFPPLWDDHNQPIGSALECNACSRAFMLADAGLSLEGGYDGDPLRSTSGWIFTLVKPAKVFALDIGGTSYTSGPTPEPDLRISLVAYDTNGMPIDAAAATYPAGAPRDPPPDYTEKLRRVLLVEACAGEAIARVDVGTTDYNTSIRSIATFAPD